jgi:hypothetical protein
MKNYQKKYEDLAQELGSDPQSKIHRSQYFEALILSDWESLLDDVICQHNDAHFLFSDPKGDQRIFAATSELSTQNFHCREQITKCLEKFLLMYLQSYSEENHHKLENTLIVIRLLKSRVEADNLIAIIDDERVDPDLQESTAQTLHEVYPDHTIWSQDKKVDINAALVVPLMWDIHEKNPAQALILLSNVSREPGNLVPYNEIIRYTLIEFAQKRTFHELFNHCFNEVKSWAQHIISQIVMSNPELSILSSKLSSLEEPPVRKVFDPKNMVIELMPNDNN